MRKTKILICGASGFIGQNLFKNFNHPRNSFDVYGTYFRNKPCVVWPNLTQCDLRDKHQALLVTKDMNIVINCAAMTDGVCAVATNPVGYLADNIRINTNLSEAAFINKVSHFIFLSCTIMYPSSTRPLKEHEHDLNNVHPKYLMFAKIKVFAEDLCRIYSGLGNTKYTVVRHTNIYGPHDKFDLIKSHVLSATITKTMKSESQIVVWGKGEESRDFLYIDDLIEFIGKAIEWQKNNFETFNVGYGKTYSVNELVQKIILCSGKNIDVVHDLEKPTVETHMNIDTEKARQYLGWSAQVSLDDGLNTTIEWYQKPPAF